MVCRVKLLASQSTQFQKLIEASTKEEQSIETTALVEVRRASES